MVVAVAVAAAVVVDVVVAVVAVFGIAAFALVDFAGHETARVDSAEYFAGVVRVPLGLVPVLVDFADAVGL